MNIQRQWPWDQIIIAVLDMPPVGLRVEALMELQCRRIRRITGPSQAVLVYKLCWKRRCYTTHVKLPMLFRQTGLHPPLLDRSSGFFCGMISDFSRALSCISALSMCYLSHRTLAPPYSVTNDSGQEYFRNLCLAGFTVQQRKIR